MSTNGRFICKQRAEFLLRMSSTTGPDDELVEEWILSIIDQLRQRKARPDLERICHFVERKHGLSRKQTESRLEKLVDDGTVIKVMYKRGTSYRNAKYAKTKKRTYVPNVLNSSLASKRIRQAILALIETKRNPLGPCSLDTDTQSASSVENGEAGTGASACDGTEQWTEAEGISSSDIELWVAAKCGGGLGPYPIHWILQREVDAKNIRVLENGNFLPLGESGADAECEQTHERPVLKKSMSVIAKRGRPTKRPLPHVLGRGYSCPNGQRFDSADIPESAPVPVMPPHLCDFCRKSADYNKYGLGEELLFCKDCNAKAHPSCMNYSTELAARARKTTWQCIDCKICCVCTDPGEADCMLFCDACDKGYHMQCHVPEVVDKPQGKWVCNDCVQDGVDIAHIEENTFINVVDRPVKPEYGSLRRFRNGDRETTRKEEEVYPSATEWTIDQVVDFFAEKGFSEHALAFQDQEIDGQSLLLLTRSDVLQGLSLKLGPALKMYNIVMKLQSVGHVTNGHDQQTT